MSSVGGNYPTNFGQFSSVSGDQPNPNIVHGNLFPYGIVVTAPPVILPAGSVDPIAINNFGPHGFVDLSTNQSVSGIKTWEDEADFNADLNVAGAVNCETTLHAQSAVTFANTLEVQGTTELVADLTVGGNTEMTGELIVSEDSVFQSTVEVQGYMTVNGGFQSTENVIFNGNLDIYGVVTSTNDTNWQGNNNTWTGNSNFVTDPNNYNFVTTFGPTPTPGDDEWLLQPNFVVNFAQVFNGPATFASSVTIDETLIVNEYTFLNNSTYFNGPGADFNGDVYFNAITGTDQEFICEIPATFTSEIGFSEDTFFDGKAQFNDVVVLGTFGCGSYDNEDGTDLTLFTRGWNTGSFTFIASNVGLCTWMPTVPYLALLGLGSISGLPFVEGDPGTPSAVTFTSDPAFIVQNSTTAGHVLTSDASGNITAQAPVVTPGGDHTWTGAQTFTQTVTVPSVTTANTYHNVYMGEGLSSLTTSNRNNNTAFGQSVLADLSGAATYNVGIGYQAMPNLDSGIGNIAIGYNAGAGQSSGNGSVYIGYQTGALANYSGCVALGNFAAADANDQLMLGSETMQTVIPGTLQFRNNASLSGITQGGIMQITDAYGTVSQTLFEELGVGTQQVSTTGALLLPLSQWTSYGYLQSTVSGSMINYYSLMAMYCSEPDMTAMDLGTLEGAVNIRVSTYAMTSFLANSLLFFGDLTLQCNLLPTIGWPLAVYCQNISLTSACYSLTSAVFPNLVTIAGSFTSAANLLSTLNLPLLASVGSFTITAPSVITLNLSALVYCAGAFSTTLLNCTSLTAPLLRFVGGAITWVSKEPNVSFPNLQYIGTNTAAVSSFSGNATLSYSFPALINPGLNGVTNAGITISTALATSISFPVMTYVPGSLSITGSVLTTLTLSSLVSLQGSLLLTTVQLPTLSLPALTSTSAITWTATNMAALTSFSMGVLQTATGTISITGCTVLTTVSFGTTAKALLNVVLSGCALNQASVDAILALLVSLNGTGGTTNWGSGRTCTLTGGTNATPSATGLTDKATLQARGATVTTN